VHPQGQAGKGTVKRGGNAGIDSHVPQAILEVDPERRVRRANRAAATLTGFTVEQLRGKRGGEALRCLHHLDDPNGCGFGPDCEQCAVRQTVLATFQTGESYQQVEADLTVWRDGVWQEITLLVSTSFLHHRHGPCVLVVLEDISERKRMERALRRKNEELSLLLNTIPTQVCYFIDIETYGAVNQAHADFLGKSKIEIEYNHFEHVLPPELHVIFRESNEKVFSTARPLHAYTWLPDCQERRRLLALSLIPFVNDRDRAECVVFSAQQISPHITSEIH
jgi:PAS domain-containing protein